MSSLVSNSEYGTDSVFDLSESSEHSSPNVKKGPSMHSSGYSIELSGIQSEAEASNSEIDSNHSISSKSDSLKSLWSASESSYNRKDHQKHILPSDASPFIFDGTIIRYNVERGVSYHTPVVFGSRKLVGAKCESGYNPSHFVFDPSKGTLAAGYDVNNGWANLPNFSIIAGIGNSAELDGSFVSGAHNSIKLQLMDGSINYPNDGPYCLVPPSCSIIGGANNNITNTAACKYTSSIIASHNVNVENCEDTVVLGMRGVTGDLPIREFSESTFTRNLYGLGRIIAGPYNNEIIPSGTVLAVLKDAQIGGNLYVFGNVDSDTVSSRTVIAQNLTASDATISNLTVSESSNIMQNSLYIAGTGGSTGINYILNPTDSYDIVYANPINGTVNIYLGTGTNNIFNKNKTITFKDTTLEFSSASSYNVNILVPNPTGVTGMVPVKIEYFNGGYTAGTNAGYSINSSGGAVTFMFSSFPIPGSVPTWTIRDQFIGNPRIMGNVGITFIAASDGTKSRMINRK